MTVGDLITYLKTQPPDVRVVIDDASYGMQEVTDPKAALVALAGPGEIPHPSVVLWSYMP